MPHSERRGRRRARVESSGMARHPPEAGRSSFTLTLRRGHGYPPFRDLCVARIALIKLFTGLNLGVSQLSGELRRAGHDTIIVYFKDYLMVPRADVSRYRVTDYALTVIDARGAEFQANCYTPFSETEYRLLLKTLEAFDPDLIGFSLTSLPMKEAAEVTARIRRVMDVPIIWGGPGPTIEPEPALRHADMVCVGEGEEVIVE